MSVTWVSEPLARICADVLVLGYFEGERPLKGFTGYVDWLAGGALSRLIVGHRATGRLHEATLVVLETFSTPTILFVGLGRASAFTYWTLDQTAKTLVGRLVGLRVTRAAVEMLGIRAGGLDPAIAARTFIKAWQDASAAEPIQLSLVVPRQIQPRQIEQRLREMGLESTKVAR